MDLIKNSFLEAQQVLEAFISDEKNLLFVKLQRLSRRQKWLRNRLMIRNGHHPVRRSRQRRHRKE